jgi:hypothetical protein
VRHHDERPEGAPVPHEWGKGRDEVIAASSVPIIQQMGFALGAALAGLVVNSSGLSIGVASEGMEQAVFWVPASFVVPAALAYLVSLRLQRLSKP